jgi:hypothetical protein
MATLAAAAICHEPPEAISAHQRSSFYIIDFVQLSFSEVVSQVNRSVQRLPGALDGQAN